MGLYVHSKVLLNQAGNNTIFTPHRFVGLWSDWPFDGGLLEGCLRTGESGGKFQMTQQPDMKYTWNTWRRRYGTCA